MKDDEVKTPPAPRWGWIMRVAAAPEMWFAAVIALVIVGVFDLTQERTGTLFHVVLIFVLIMGSVLAVSLIARSLRRGKSTFGPTEKRR
jgi:hypothetical protein